MAVNAERLAIDRGVFHCLLPMALLALANHPIMGNTPPPEVAKYGSSEGLSGYAVSIPDVRSIALTEQRQRSPSRRLFLTRASGEGNRFLLRSADADATFWSYKWI